MNPEPDNSFASFIRSGPGKACVAYLVALLAVSSLILWIVIAQPQFAWPTSKSSGPTMIPMPDGNFMFIP